jgi:hypothetical protein
METVIYVVKATGAIATRVETRDRGEQAGDILPVADRIAPAAVTPPE